MYVIIMDVWMAGWIDGRMDGWMCGLPAKIGDYVTHSRSLSLSVCVSDWMCEHPAVVLACLSVHTILLHKKRHVYRPV